MGELFEIFGYPIEDRSAEAEKSRSGAWCPFMGQECDGGGNRYLSSNDLTEDAELAARFRTDIQEVASGVCSIRPNPDSDPWIVCPRRLLVLGREAAGTRTCQVDIERDAVSLLGYPEGTRLGVWPEVKLKAADSIAESTKRFDYTFDYVVMPLGSLTRECEPDLPWNSKLNDWGLLGYGPASGGEALVNAPVGQPTIIEIMTSSTSGGNKRRNTTIPQAFRDSIIMGRPALGPGINYRQVWARMVSQLIVKSEVAMAWGGNALWVIQDVLAEYISDTTALNMTHHRSDGLSEVNVLSLSYGDQGKATSGVIELPDRQLFAGPIAGSADETDGFLDIIRAGVKPERAVLVNALLSRRPSAEIVVA